MSQIPLFDLGGVTNKRPPERQITSYTRGGDQIVMMREGEKKRRFLIGKRLHQVEPCAKG